MIRVHWRYGLGLAAAALLWGLRAWPKAEHWVGTWGCGPQLTERSNLPPAPLAQSTLRQFVHLTLGGKTARVRFSNAYGTNPVVMNSAHVALAAGAGSAGGGAIDPATDKPLRFQGAPSATIPPGEAVSSDPLAYDLPRLTNLAVSIYFGQCSATTITPFGGHRYYTPGHEAVRKAVNAWIRAGGKFDAVIDFDAVVRDPATLTNLLSAYDSGDGLHLNPAGYRAMADSIDLGLFAR